MNFNKSKTKENLMRAFAGESQARNRYIFSAKEAQKNNLYVIEAVFEFTAKQEDAHAKVFYDNLLEMGGGNVDVNGNYPVDVYSSVLDLLKAAAHNENQEYEVDYRKFAEEAKEEGYTKIYNIFSNIAEIEKTHSNRFDKFAKLLESNRLFINDVETEWMCLNCGFVFKGKNAPESCPVCKHSKGYFVRIELAPFTKQY